MKKEKDQDKKQPYTEKELAAKFEEIKAEVEKYFPNFLLIAIPEGEAGDEVRAFLSFPQDQKPVEEMATNLAAINLAIDDRLRGPFGFIYNTIALAAARAKGQKLGHQLTGSKEHQLSVLKGIKGKGKKKNKPGGVSMNKKK